MARAPGARSAQECNSKLAALRSLPTTVALRSPPPFTSPHAPSSHSMEIDSSPLMQRQVDASAGSTQLQPPSQQARPIVRLSRRTGRRPPCRPTGCQGHVDASWRPGQPRPVSTGVGWRLRCVETATAVSWPLVRRSMSLEPRGGMWGVG